MQKKIKLLVALIAISTLTFYKCECTQKSDQTKAVMFMGNANHENKYASADVKINPEIKWKVKTNGAVLSSPVFSNNTIYVGSNDQKLYAVDAETGYVKWKFKTNGEIASTPAIVKDKIMFLSYDGYFYALNRNGKLAWKFKTGGEKRHRVNDYFDNTIKSEDFWDFFLSSAVIKGESVYFGSSDSHIYSLNIDSGELNWKFKTKGSVHSSPAIQNNTLVVGDWDSQIYAIDIKSSKQKWNYTTGRDTTYYCWIGVQGSPSIEDNTVYIGSRDALVYAFDLQTGDTIWTQNDFGRSWMPSSYAVGKNNIFSGSSDARRLYAIDKKTGSIDYKAPTNSYTFSSPAITNNMVYIGSANGRLYAFDQKTGAEKWNFKSLGNGQDGFKLYDDKGIMKNETMMEIIKTCSNLSDYNMAMQNVFEQYGAIVSSPIIHDRVIYYGSHDGYIYAITDKTK